MGRPKGPETENKIQDILECIKSHKNEDIWYGKIAKEVGYSVGLVYYLINKYMLDDVELEEKVNDDTNVMVLVKLR